MANPVGSQRVGPEVGDLDGQLILERIVELPVTRGGAHVGPTPRDFHAAFGLGDDDTQIDPLDAIGVVLMAIKALRADLDDLRALVRAIAK